MGEYLISAPLVVMSAALCALAWNLRNGLSVQNNVSSQQPQPAQIKVIMPSDIQKVSALASVIGVMQKQPDGTYHRVGEVSVDSVDDRSTWPQRLHDELAIPGRAIQTPDGEIDEGLQ